MLSCVPLSLLKGEGKGFALSLPIEPATNTVLSMHRESLI